MENKSGSCIESFTAMMVRRSADEFGAGRARESEG